MKKIIILLIIFIPFSVYGKKTEVKLLSGGDAQHRMQIEEILTTVLNELNKSKELAKPVSHIEQFFTNFSYVQFMELINKTKMFASEDEYRTYLITLKNGLLEVRNIKVKIKLGQTEGIPFQNLVFQFNKSGKIESVFFSIDQHQYETIITEGKKLNDLLYREKILHFIELYRTAYSKKDSLFIAQTLSKDALIIVGHVVKVQKTDTDMFSKSYLSTDQIEFIRLSKNQYLERLGIVFRKNDFVRVEFDEININVHQKFNKIYGIQLKQRWNSSTYSDEGYLFLMIDFSNENNPIIHVRAWQPDKFPDGSTVSLYDFEIASY